MDPGTEHRITWGPLSLAPCRAPRCLCTELSALMAMRVLLIDGMSSLAEVFEPLSRCFLSTDGCALFVDLTISAAWSGGCE